MPVVLRSVRPHLQRPLPPTLVQTPRPHQVGHLRQAIRISGRRLLLRPGDVAVYMPFPTNSGPLPPSRNVLVQHRRPPRRAVRPPRPTPGVYPFGDPPSPTSTGNDRRPPRSVHQPPLQQLAIHAVRSRQPCPLSSPPSSARSAPHPRRASPTPTSPPKNSLPSYNHGSLSRTFHHHTGMTIMDCITQNRLQLAELLLLQTSRATSAISPTSAASATSPGPLDQKSTSAASPRTPRLRRWSSILRATPRKA